MHLYLWLLNYVSLLVFFCRLVLFLSVYLFAISPSPMPSPFHPCPFQNIHAFYLSPIPPLCHPCLLLRAFFPYLSFIFNHSALPSLLCTNVGVIIIFPAHLPLCSLGAYSFNVISSTSVILSLAPSFLWCLLNMNITSCEFPSGWFQLFSAMACQIFT